MTFQSSFIVPAYAYYTYPQLSADAVYNILTEEIPSLDATVVGQTVRVHFQTTPLDAVDHSDALPDVSYFIAEYEEIVDMLARSEGSLPDDIEAGFLKRHAVVATGMLDATVSYVERLIEEGGEYLGTISINICAAGEDTDGDLDEDNTKTDSDPDADLEDEDVTPIEDTPDEEGDDEDDLEENPESKLVMAASVSFFRCNHGIVCFHHNIRADVVREEEFYDSSTNDTIQMIVVQLLLKLAGVEQSVMDDRLAKVYYGVWNSRDMIAGSDLELVYNLTCRMNEYDNLSIAQMKKLYRDVVGVVPATTRSDLSLFTNTNAERFNIITTMDETDEAQEPWLEFMDSDAVEDLMENPELYNGMLTITDAETDLPFSDIVRLAFTMDFGIQLNWEALETTPTSIRTGYMVAVNDPSGFVPAIEGFYAEPRVSKSFVRCVFPYILEKSMEAGIFDLDLLEAGVSAFEEEGYANFLRDQKQFFASN